MELLQGLLLIHQEGSIGNILVPNLVHWLPASWALVQTIGAVEDKPRNRTPVSICVNAARRHDHRHRPFLADNLRLHDTVRQRYLAAVPQVEFEIGRAEE